MNRLYQLYLQYCGFLPTSCQKIAGGGSSRQYYRLSDGHGGTLIGAIGNSREENRTFFYLSRHFLSEGLRVPVIVAVSEDELCYLQSDMGTTSLYEALKQGRESATGYSHTDIQLLEKAITLLPKIQVRAAKTLDFSHCYPKESLDKENVLFDLNYFKYCFLKTTDMDFNESRLEDDLQTMADTLQAADSPHFMYRDFQARNLMLPDDGEPALIDYQGGRRGPVQYDLISFLWQASSHFPKNLRSHLIDVYITALKGETDMDEATFRESLPRWVLFRTMQVLGAYGLRGRFQQKPYFLNSIPAAIGNLREVLQDDASCPCPYLREVLTQMVSLPEFSANANIAVQSSAANGVEIALRVSQQITNTASHSESIADGKIARESRQCMSAAVRGVRQEDPIKSERLQVRVISFSYKKGIPEDGSGNGGGYVFDCRGTHNPGRYEEYKRLTGLDRAVKEFLEKDGEITIFLEHVRAIADTHIRRYMERGFTSLMFCFGCTGGQHRSVYCAEHLGRYINERFGVQVSITHREQGIFRTLPLRRKVMVFAAGLGTRLKPLTDTMPKALVPVAGRPLIEHVCGKLVSAGFNDIIVNVHHFASQIVEWGNEWMNQRETRGDDERARHEGEFVAEAKVTFSDETERLLDTGGGISHAAALLESGNAAGRFLIHNVDILSNVDLAAMWTAQPDADALLLVSSRETARYLVFDERMLLCGWVNIQTGEVRTQDELLRSHLSQLEVGQLEVGGYRLRAFAGIHIMQTSMLERFDSYPEKCSIIDFYLGECGHCTIMGYEQEGLRLLDVGKLTTLQDAEAYVRNLG